MAGQITHLVYADEFWRKHKTLLDRHKFLVGALFPDTRYLDLDAISRHQTHLEPGDLTGVLKERDSFLAGVKFHTFLDETRKLYLREHNVYQVLPFETLQNEVLKLLEDELVYDWEDDWLAATNYFKNVLPEELKFQVDKAAVQQWHELLGGYFEAKPNDRTRVRFLSGLSVPKAEIKETEQKLDITRQIPELNQTILDFAVEFNSLIATSE